MKKFLLFAGLFFSAQICLGAGLYKPFKNVTGSALMISSELAQIHCKILGEEGDESCVADTRPQESKVSGSQESKVSEPSGFARRFFKGEEPVEGTEVSKLLPQPDSQKRKLVEKPVVFVYCFPVFAVDCSLLKE